MLQLSMKRWNSAFNARGPRLIIVGIQFGEVKIYVAAVDALRKKDGQDETQFITKIDGILSFIPNWMLMYFLQCFFLISPCVWPNSGFWCCVFVSLLITLTYMFWLLSLWAIMISVFFFPGRIFALCSVVSKTKSAAKCIKDFFSKCTKIRSLNI